MATHELTAVLQASAHHQKDYPLCSCRLWLKGVRDSDVCYVVVHMELTRTSTLSFRRQKRADGSASSVVVQHHISQGDGRICTIMAHTLSHMRSALRKAVITEVVVCTDNLNVSYSVYNKTATTCQPADFEHDRPA